jgi:Cytidylyltransferase
VCPRQHDSNVGRVYPEAEMKIAAIIQVRIASSRRPNKVLIDLGGVTVLERVFIASAAPG